MDTKNLAVIGFGGRGHIYGEFSRKYPEKFQLKAVAETDEYRRRDAKENFGAEVYEDYKELLDQGYRLDLVAIATQDAQHKEHALYALNRGYDLLLEKPVAITAKDCLEIYECAKKNNRRVYVCHVLRYTPFYSKIKEIIDEGTLGEIVNVHASENVGYYHQAHSYVRGPWRNSGESSPMILAKCCHDMDIYTWLLGKKCKAISSVGDTHLFKKECAPEGATPYCLGGCKAKENCKFDAEKIYITNPATGIRNGNTWMAGVACGVNPTEERTYEALKNGQYGRCVYMCDNNVVDHQQTNLLFEDGTTMSFTMCAFTEKCYRYFKAMGTNGEIEADMLSNKIHVRVFGEPEEIIDVKLLANDLKGHGGGDSGIVNDFLDMLINETEATERTTTLEHSLESHFMALAAEESRLRGGELINMDAFKNGK